MLESILNFQVFQYFPCEVLPSKTYHMRASFINFGRYHENRLRVNEINGILWGLVALGMAQAFTFRYQTSDSLNIAPLRTFVQGGRGRLSKGCHSKKDCDTEANSLQGKIGKGRVRKCCSNRKVFIKMIGTLCKYNFVLFSVTNEEF